MAAKARTKKEPVRSDAYVGMLFISLVAMIIGSVLLYLDYSQYPTDAPTVKAAAGGGGTGGKPPTPAGSGGQPGR